jgi:lysyl-tRNA synthetase class I
LTGWLIELTIMEVTQISSKELISYTDTKRKPTKHGKHKPDYYTKNKEKYLLAQKKYRLKLHANKPPKPLSEFQQTKQKQFLKLLVNHRSFVPVPTKLKHPIIKN